MSNIYDISKRTGYSASTVARALSGRGYCSAKAREVIQKAAKDMNYVPVQAAKTLKSKQTHKIMLCIPDLFNPYYFSMIDGVGTELEKHGYYTVLVHTQHDKQKEMDMVTALNELFVDGLIIVSFDFDKQLIDALRAAPVPVVLTNLYEDNGNEGFDCVYVDHTKATYAASKHLLDKGHQQIAFLGGSRKEQTGQERLDGYVQAMQEAGIRDWESYVIESDFTRKGGRRTFTDFLNKDLPFSAVLACNDLMAIGCLNACTQRNLSVPGDVSIISLDNTDYCSCTSPRLSSVDMRQLQIGENAAKMIMERIKKERDYTKLVKLDPLLVERESVATCK